MDERFNHIDTTNPKVHKIINCAFQEFSHYSFEKASTNNIVKKAKISRGLLYHYFKDKQDLYEFLIYYSLKITAEHMDQKIDWEETDFLARMRQAHESRLEDLFRYPYLTTFFQQIYNSGSDAVTEMRNKFEEYYPGLRNKIYTHNIDFTTVKEGIDIKKMINTVRYTLRLVGKELWDEIQGGKKEFDKDVFLKIYDEYLDFFRKVFFE